jgi:hypothetical protein
MRGKKAQDDQRQTYRCPVADSRRKCALSFGGDPVSAILLDQSAGGFAALVQLADEPRVGLKAVLQTDSGQFNVRLAYVSRSLPPKDVLPEVVEYWKEELPLESETWYRLGLSREGETVILEEPRWSPFFGNFFLWRRNFMQFSRVIFYFGIFLVLAVAALPTVLKWAGIGSAKVPAMANDGTIVGQRQPFMPVAGEGQDGNPIAPADAMQSRDSRREQDNATSSGGAASEPSVDVLRGMLQRLSGPTALALPEVVGMLRLTAQQQAKIARIIDDTAEAIRQLDAQAAAEGIPRVQLVQLRDELLTQSRREAEAVLDQRQQRQWERLLSRKPVQNAPSP